MENPLAAVQAVRGVDAAKTRVDDSTKATVEAEKTGGAVTKAKARKYTHKKIARVKSDKKCSKADKSRMRETRARVQLDTATVSDSDLTSSDLISSDSEDGGGSGTDSDAESDNTSAAQNIKQSSLPPCIKSDRDTKKKKVHLKKPKKPIHVKKLSDPGSGSSSDESDFESDSDSSLDSEPTSSSDSHVSGAYSSDGEANSTLHCGKKGGTHHKRQKQTPPKKQRKTDLRRLLLIFQQQLQLQQNQLQLQLQQNMAPKYVPPLGLQAGNPLGQPLNQFSGPNGLNSLASFNSPNTPNSLSGISLDSLPPPSQVAGRPNWHFPTSLPDRRFGPYGRLGDLDTGPKQELRNSKHKTLMDFKRVDQIWDKSTHSFKLQETAARSQESEYSGYLFHVRRTFSIDGKHNHTFVDIKSSILREALQEIIGNVKGVSFVEGVPKLDPNLLFLYLDDMRKYQKNCKEAKPVADSKNGRRKERKRMIKKQKQLRVLIKYLDKDYETVKNSLYPLLENGLITFNLLWALWKPNTLVCGKTYGSLDEPCIFKVEIAEKQCSLVKGESYYVEGKYFEFDGKNFGHGSVADEVGEFRGARKITSLPIYPIHYHKNEKQLRKDLIERGKKFVALSGVQYKSYDGMAYYRKKKAVVKVNVTGRIMIDSSIHRRINPNYPVSSVRADNNDDSDTSDKEDDDNDDLNGYSGGRHHGQRLVEDDEIERVSSRILQDKKTEKLDKLPLSSQDDITSSTRNSDHTTQTGDSTDGADTAANTDADANANGDANNDGGAAADKIQREFSDEDYLTASAIVLGFSFVEKLWLEFAVSGVQEINWNESAYESLVLEPKTKDIIKALVESHKYHAAESIDDVIQGKGKGLVAVLHGPPGTGKTLTAESISELLKCPLYMVSAGELGTDSRFLEAELQKILDICHAWGAILLLDEADVFLEKRNMHEIHRNALVSIFLRQLEYFQGILFLTTNRVETFDDAFQSRIHIALRYDNLDQRAKKTIFKIFIERVRVLEKIDLMPFSDEDLNTLARYNLNGRQIKNTVCTAQALAVNKREPLSMSHIRQVLDVHISFDRDLKGGPGFQDAMRSYF